MERLLAGNVPTPLKKKYTAMNTRIQWVVDICNSRPIDDYLRAIVHNFEL